MKSVRPISIHRVMVKKELTNSYFASFFLKRKMELVVVMRLRNEETADRNQQGEANNELNLNDFPQVRWTAETLSSNL